MSIAMNQLDFRGASILVVGDLMLDQYWLGDTSRISPEAPVPVVKISSSEDRLGGAANAALNARALGANVALAGIVGDDGNGLMLKKLVKEHSIQDLSFSSKDAKTISKLRMISRSQQMLRADFEEPFNDADVNDLTRDTIEQLENFDILILSDYNKGSLSQCEKLIAKAKSLNIKVIVDPKGNDFNPYKGAYILTPNLSEFETIVGKCKDEQDMFNKADQLIKDLDLHALLLTRSEQGMTLFMADGSHHHFNAQAKEVFDVTGAGDTVIACLSTALAKNLDLPDAVQLANIAASISVGRMGAASVTPLELKLAIEHSNAQPTGITDIDQLKALVSFEQSLGKKIVFTNGCFDILHSGHVQYLTEAGHLGDRLIVAINDDASVKRLKGEERPVNTVADRMAVLCGLKPVDWVISFDDDTPESLLHDLKPDVLVKGGDYGIDEVVGSDIVNAYGGEVKVLSLQEGVSTTNIIDSIKTQ